MQNARKYATTEKNKKQNKNKNNKATMTNNHHQWTTTIEIAVLPDSESKRNKIYYNASNTN